MVIGGLQNNFQSNTIFFEILKKKNYLVTQAAVYTFWTVIHEDDISVWLKNN